MEIPKREYWRKSVHLSGVFLVPVLLWNRHLFAALLAAFLAVYILVEVLAKRGRRVPFLSELTENSKRGPEKDRLSKGALYLALAGIATPYLFGAQAAAVALTQAFTADVTSTFAGIKWGTKKLPYARGKSWAGSLTYLATAFAAALPFVSPTQAALLALVGAAVESLPIPEADNLTIPLTVAFAARFLA